MRASLAVVAVSLARRGSREATQPRRRACRPRARPCGRSRSHHTRAPGPGRDRRDLRLEVEHDARVREAQAQGGRRPGSRRCRAGRRRGGSRRAPRPRPARARAPRRRLGDDDVALRLEQPARRRAERRVIVHEHHGDGVLDRGGCGRGGVHGAAVIVDGHVLRRSTDAWRYAARQPPSEVRIAAPRPWMSPRGRALNDAAVADAPAQRAAVGVADRARAHGLVEQRIGGREGDRAHARHARRSAARRASPCSSRRPGCGRVAPARCRARRRSPRARRCGRPRAGAAARGTASGGGSFSGAGRSGMNPQCRACVRTAPELTGAQLRVTESLETGDGALLEGRPVSWVVLCGKGGSGGAAHASRSLR